MIKIPSQLKIPELRFALCERNGKIPIEKAWNKENNYSFFEDRLLNHLKANGNYNVCTGFANLIVIDFDCEIYQQIISHKLPKTFTTKTANKGLYHKYYFFEGEMIKKIGIGFDNRLCDIQAKGQAVIGPGSVINRKIYTIADESEIQTITKEQLKEIFQIKSFSKPRSGNDFDPTGKPEEVKKMALLLKHLGVENTHDNYYKCFKHSMNGHGNVCLYNNAHLHCFHCGFHVSSADDLAVEYLRWQK